MLETFNIIIVIWLLITDFIVNNYFIIIYGKAIAKDTAANKGILYLLVK